MCKEKGFLSVHSVGGFGPWASRPIPLSVCSGMGRSHDGENRSLHEKEAESGRVGAESTVCFKGITHPHPLCLGSDGPLPSPRVSTSLAYF